MELSTNQKIESIAKDFQDFSKECESSMNSFNERLQEICNSFNTNTTKIGKYDVDMDNKTCSCPHFQYRLKGTGKLCKHLKEAINNFASDENLYTRLYESNSDQNNMIKIGKYDVDVDNKTCSCPHFQYRLKGYNTLCKHLEQALRI